MLNRSGVTKTSYAAPKQILANVELQASVGCIVSQSIGVDVNGKKIAKAGTPIVVNFGNLQTPAVAPTEASGDDPAVPATAVLLHDVDVTDGNANGTALIFGFVNINRLDSDVWAKVKAASGADVPERPAFIPVTVGYVLFIRV